MNKAEKIKKLIDDTNSKDGEYTKELSDLFINGGDKNRIRELQDLIKKNQEYFQCRLSEIFTFGE